jgi:hypothetical protein
MAFAARRRTPISWPELTSLAWSKCAAVQPIDPEARTTLYVASPEDTILAKLQWYVDGGCVSDRQWKDVLGVLKVQSAALDRAYLVAWARELGLADLYSRAVEEAGLPGVG